LPLINSVPSICVIILAPEVLRLSTNFGGQYGFFEEGIVIQIPHEKRILSEACSKCLKWNPPKKLTLEDLGRFSSCNKGTFYFYQKRVIRKIG
jgi:hypothetical protein